MSYTGVKAIENLNQLDRIENTSHSVELDELWLNSNKNNINNNRHKIRNWSRNEELRNLTRQRSLFLEKNLIQSNVMFRKKLMNIAPILGKDNLMNNDNSVSALNGGPELVANAMVTVVRFILLILICVLLVKLRSPHLSVGDGKGKRRKISTIAAQGDELNVRKENKNSGNKQDDDYDDDNDDDADLSFGTDEETKQQHLNDNSQIFRLGFNNSMKSNNRLISEQNISRMNLGHNNNKLQPKRRPSEPALLNREKSQELARENHKIMTVNSTSVSAAERRRRHSDTCLAQLTLPPGPMGLPFLGYLPFLGRNIHLTLTSLSDRYGPIYQIFLGGIRVVVLNDATLVRQAFKQPVFSGRPDTQLTRILQGYGIVNSDGALWKEQRAFLHSALRKLGAKSLMSGTNGLESKIQNQVKEFVNDLSVHADGGKPCQVRPFVARAVSSVVGSIVMNLTYRKYEEKEKFDRLIELMQEGFRLFTIAMPLNFIPIFRFLPGVSYAYKKMKKNRAETSAFFQGVADEHRKYLSETFNLGTTSSPNSLHPSLTSLNTSLNVSSPANSSTLKYETSQLQAIEVGQVEEQRQQQQQQQKAAATSFSPAAAASAQQLVSSTTGETGATATSTAAASFTDATNEEQQQQQDKVHVELEQIVARDLVDAYIVQQKKHEKDGRENYFSDQQLVQIMSDIFSAGLETVTSTIEWSILFLILNPECQQMIQNEIDSVIGRERSPKLEDLSQMPYTEATIYEVLRRSNVVALGNTHATLEDASIGGYRIPKGTQVLPNLYGIHMNPKLWNQPDRFDPARFIVNEKAHKPDYFIPFSVGRRMCLGDLLAKMEVFLFLVGLLQKFDLSVAEEDRNCPPQVKGTSGVSTTPASFRFALTSRQAVVSLSR